MPTVLHWFRQDLRLSDNPALTLAALKGAILPVFILDTSQDTLRAERTIGHTASDQWLHHALTALSDSLDGRLRVMAGDPRRLLPQIVAEHDIAHVTWTRVYDPYQSARDSQIKSDLNARGTQVHSLNGSLLWEPWDIKKPDGTPYRVFTPFFRKGCASAPAPRKPLPAPKLTIVPHDAPCDISTLNLLAKKQWSARVMASWNASEASAQARLHDFVAKDLSDYKEGRDFPARPNVSRLSPHLHFGTLSPNQAWYAASRQNNGTAHFRSELGWREFSYGLLFNNPDLGERNLNARFDAFPWRNAPEHLEAWQNGRTGIPIVDAGMRELWATGYMHNRVRMITASFLTKNLMIHWRKGQDWFSSTLLDADHAVNSASWQWVAGCGADAAPFFRIFNPVTQARRFDPNGSYVRKWVPELSALPDKALFAPWESPASVLKTASVRLGATYPKPITCLKTSRNAALAAYALLKSEPET